jgi:hypothetical protein
MIRAVRVPERGEHLRADQELFGERRQEVPIGLEAGDPPGRGVEHNVVREVGHRRLKVLLVHARWWAKATCNAGLVMISSSGVALLRHRGPEKRNGCEGGSRSRI